MLMLQNILSTYASFFDLHMWKEVLSDPVAWGLIGSLVLLEGLLSADNALVLAVMVRHLPEEQRKKALMYGLWGAYIFRFIAIGLGTYLVKFTIVKVFGALYLLWLSFKFFKERYIDKKDADNPEDEAVNVKDGFLARYIGVFWATVATVELMDISFSVDSILASFAVSNEVWVLFMGGVLGILMMRGIAGVFITIIDKIPELETTAYVLIAFIGLKMLLSIDQIGIEINHTVFFSIIILAFVGTFIIHYLRKGKSDSKEEKKTA
ncbi:MULTISPECIES: TerC family protein [Bacillus]|uniref:DUF475 domain-containing protein n=2 Tax=Bacillus cereus TaxID=1396 RepID=A0A9X0MK20_BACCE|nr:MULTISPECIES: TerC family protein [Bacillus cereus group]KXY51100.1 hypothetical protein AT268_31860 [Bacillus cereus]